MVTILIMKTVNCDHDRNPNCEDYMVAQKTTGSAHLSLVHGSTEDEVLARLALMHGGNENDASCCCMEVLMTLHAFTLHGCVEDEVGRYGACGCMHAC